jgi:hypothetical protein
LRHINRFVKSSAHTSTHNGPNPVSDADSRLIFNFICVDTGKRIRTTACQPGFVSRNRNNWRYEGKFTGFTGTSLDSAKPRCYKNASS